MNVNTADASALLVTAIRVPVFPAIRVPVCPGCVAVSQHPRLPPVSFYGRASVRQLRYIVHCIWGWAVGVWSPLSRPQGSVVSGVVAWSCVCVSGSGWYMCVPAPPVSFCPGSPRCLFTGTFTVLHMHRLSRLSC